MNEAPSPADSNAAYDHLLRGLYGPYVYLVFLVLGSLALLAVTLVPGLTLARSRVIVHRVARLFFRVAGLPVRIRGLERLPDGGCVLVANHASYLDGVVLKAALPARFSFVIKNEMAKAPLAATLLRRIGSEFVDRANRHAGGMDARRLIRVAATGQALVFFPEGTFTPTAGLERFHNGAFATAARAQVPIVPAVIRGTRRILPCDRWFPRWHPIDIEVFAPIEWTGAMTVEAMRDQARARILAALDEPDLQASESARI